MQARTRVAPIALSRRVFGAADMSGAASSSGSAQLVAAESSADARMPPVAAELRSLQAASASDTGKAVLKAAALRVDNGDPLFMRLPGEEAAIIANITFVPGTEHFTIVLELTDTEGKECVAVSVDVLYISKHVASDERALLVCWDEELVADGEDGAYQLLLLQAFPHLNSQGTLIEQLMAGLPGCPRTFDATELAILQDARDELLLGSSPFPLDITGAFVFARGEHVSGMMPEQLTDELSTSFALINQRTVQEGGICQMHLQGDVLEASQLKHSRSSGSSGKPFTFKQPSDDEPQLGRRRTSRKGERPAPGVLTTKGDKESLQLTGCLYLALKRPCDEWMLADPSLRVQFRRRPGIMPIGPALAVATPPTVQLEEAR